MSKPTFTFATEEFLKPQVINCILSNILKITVYNLLDTIVNSQNVTVIADAGLMEPEKGKVTLNNFKTNDNTAIRITVLPNSLDLAPKRNQLISIDNSYVVITPEIDSIAVAGSSGTITYTTTSRFK